MFDGVGANSATDPLTAGQTIMGALREGDKPVKAAVDDAYTAARGMAAGRMVELDRGAFSQTANAALDDGMWGRFLPADVRGLLNDISSGKAPFTVEAGEQIDGILSAAQREAGHGTPQHSAVAVIRSALRETTFAPGAAEAGRLGAAAIDEGAAAREAFQQARSAARQRFATIDQTPALKAALSDEAPDDFVRKYVLSAKRDELAAMKHLLENSPDALEQARAQVAAHLKNAAFGPNASSTRAQAPGGVFLPHRNGPAELGRQGGIRHQRQAGWRCICGEQFRHWRSFAEPVGQAVRGAHAASIARSAGSGQPGRRNPHRAGNRQSLGARGKFSRRPLCRSAAASPALASSGRNGGRCVSGVRAMSDHQNADAAPDCLAVETPAPQPEPPGAERALPLFVRDYFELLEVMQQEWLQMSGDKEVPPVALLVDSSSPPNVNVFVWPVPWLH